MIPKKLHQTWRTKDLSGIPEFDACAQSWKAHHPAFEYLLWDDRDNAEFVRTHFASYHDTWLSFDKNIKRIDSIRYMWMYKYGGIYADLDMECLKPLNELIKRHSDANSILFCDFDAKGNCISANPALLISKPGSNFWLEMLEYAKTHLNEYVIECTGPNALASVVNAVGKNFQVKCLDQNSLFIRKHNKPMYTRIMGNEFDFEIYRHVFCTTEKPDKYYQDRKHKFVADWHGTPERYRWRNEYKQKGLRGAFTKLKRRARNLFKL